jgi:hypothetical protein
VCHSKSDIGKKGHEILGIILYCDLPKLAVHMVEGLLLALNSWQT